MASAWPWRMPTGEYKSRDTEIGGLQALALGGGWLVSGGDRGVLRFWRF